MRGCTVTLKMLGSKSKKQFTEWDEAIFLAAFQVFEDAIEQEPNIISRFRYKPEKDLALKLQYVKTQEELANKVKKAKNPCKKANNKEVPARRRCHFNGIVVFPL
jgi:hypothetical protein